MAKAKRLFLFGLQSSATQPGNIFHRNFRLQPLIGGTFVLRTGDYLKRRIALFSRFHARTRGVETERK
jgi:hypothetical protein